jgi:hypothetical protein
MFVPTANWFAHAILVLRLLIVSFLPAAQLSVMFPSLRLDAKKLQARYQTFAGLQEALSSGFRHNIVKVNDGYITRNKSGQIAVVAY